MGTFTPGGLRLSVAKGWGGLRMVGRPDGGGRPLVRVDVQEVWNHDRARMERRELYIDRENDRYVQEWTDLMTGAVVWRKEGRLSDPMMHGRSARRCG